MIRLTLNCIQMNFWEGHLSGLELRGLNQVPHPCSSKATHIKYWVYCIDRSRPVFVVLFGLFFDQLAIFDLEAVSDLLQLETGQVILWH